MRHVASALVALGVLVRSEVWMIWSNIELQTFIFYRHHRKTT